jgi:NMD protein affecting ribosome stability and mRNA decay
MRASRYRTRFHDPSGDRYGIPTFWWQGAPDGYATVRQLRAAGLRPGGQFVAAQVKWMRRGRERTAFLYRVDAAKPKRTATPRQREAIDRALIARMRCPTCRLVCNYFIPRRYGECLDCAGL